MTAVAGNPSVGTDVLAVLVRYCIDDVMDAIETNPAVKDPDKRKLRKIANDAKDAANVGTLAAFDAAPLVYGKQSDTVCCVNIASEMKTLRTTVKPRTLTEELWLRETQELLNVYGVMQLT